jgi:hypothetical protein
LTPRAPAALVAALTLSVLGGATLCRGARADALPDSSRSAAPGPGAFSTNANPRTHSSLRKTGALLIVGGVAFDVVSFILADRADKAYEDYRNEIDPVRVESQYRRAVHMDRWASASLVAGQAAVAGGLYLVLVRAPRSHSESAPSSLAPESPRSENAAAESRLGAWVRAPYVGLSLRF